MGIVVNGQPHEVRDGTTLEQLLGELKVPRQFTAVALNREVVARSAYSTLVLSDGDRVEIVRPMAGG
jgi:sulfur carrier protein